jgi:hypothetical protein
VAIQDSFVVVAAIISDSSGHILLATTQKLLVPDALICTMNLLLLSLLQIWLSPQVLVLFL